jgi:hypothetical protein
MYTVYVGKISCCGETKLAWLSNSIAPYRYTCCDFRASNLAGSPAPVLPDERLRVGRVSAHVSSTLPGAGVNARVRNAFVVTAAAGRGWHDIRCYR